MDIQSRNAGSEIYGHHMSEIFKKLSNPLENLITTMNKYYNKKRKIIEPFEEGELVMLNGMNIRAKHQCKKLEDMMYRPFKIVSTGKNQHYCKLELPTSWKIHSTFNIDLLERY